MADLQDKIAFSKRLDHALDLFGVPPKGKGRQVILGKMFNVSQKAANKWLEGISLPDTMRIAVIADKLNVNVEWLTYGTGPINAEPLPGTGDSRWKRVPLISWDQAANYENFDVKTVEKWTWTDVECSTKTFGVIVEDDSMMPRYEEGAVVIFDPEYLPQHRSVVIFKWILTGETGCAQLLIDGPNKYLKPNNPDYKALQIDQENPQIVFCATARQIFMNY